MTTGSSDEIESMKIDGDHVILATRKTYFSLEAMWFSSTSSLRRLFITEPLKNIIEWSLQFISKKSSVILSHNQSKDKRLRCVIYKQDMNQVRECSYKNNTSRKRRNSDLRKRQQSLKTGYQGNCDRSIDCIVAKFEEAAFTDRWSPRKHPRLHPRHDGQDFGWKHELRMK